MLETLEPATQELSTGENVDLQSEVTMLDAIKHLIQVNAIPLSTSKTVRFTYVAQSSEAYPYMKTALEKKMIGSTTNPETLISCDVYMVMKGLAEGRTVTRTSDVKADYWKAATQREELNGCLKGARLTVANL